MYEFNSNFSKFREAICLRFCIRSWMPIKTSKEKVSSLGVWRCDAAAESSDGCDAEGR